MIKEQLLKDLNDVLKGEPWYGASVKTILDRVEMDKVHDKRCSPNSIAEILMHMVAWTEETSQRLKGKFASNPDRGDWPDPGDYTWLEIVELFLSANEHLKATIVTMDDDRLNCEVNDDRYPELAEKGTCEELVKGIIQHHIYHSAQIALLNK